VFTFVQLGVLQGSEQLVGCKARSGIKGELFCLIVTLVSSICEHSSRESSK
jgi:hypothetical protein